MDSYQAFLQRYPEFAATEAVDRLRETEYRRLDEQGHTYLDYTGGSLYAASQVTAHAALLNDHVFGNPHSGSPTSLATTTLVERTRRAVLDWFHASPDDYTAIFTANATGALKHVGESFPFAEGSQFVLTFDNHNSVNGIREFALRKGAAVEYVPLTVPELRIDQERFERFLSAPPARPGVPRLFAFPAQSNFTGVVHPLSFVAEAQARGWRVLLDAAAYVPTHPLDLRTVRPDFVSLSFYKMFGYPTGIGCLLARRDALATLQRPWFAGGTVNFATVQARAHILSPGEAGYEDGTLDYLGIPAVEIGLRHLASVGMQTIETRVRCLTGWLLDRLVALTHTNGRPMVRIYGPVTTAGRGGTVTMNLYDPDGKLLDYRRVEELAAAERISIRTGCFCNPGAGETAEGLTEDDIQAAMHTGVDMNLPAFMQFIAHRSGKSAGSIRVSLGIASTFGDVARLLRSEEHTSELQSH